VSLDISAIKSPSARPCYHTSEPLRALCLNAHGPAHAPAWSARDEPAQSGDRVKLAAGRPRALAAFSWLSQAFSRSCLSWTRSLAGQAVHL
jgi:hypothetical protein